MVQDAASMVVSKFKTKDEIPISEHLAKMAEQLAPFGQESVAPLSTRPCKPLSVFHIISILVDTHDEEPASAPIFWISKWVDYSNKYGLSYQLSDGSVGVIFNDGTKLLCD